MCMPELTVSLPLWIVSQVIMLVSVVAAVYSLQQRSKIKTLLWGSITMSIQVVAFAILLNWVLVGVLAVAIIRQIAFVYFEHRSEKGKPVKFWMPCMTVIVASIVTAVSVALTWEWWFDWVILAVSVFINFAVWAKGIHLMRASFISNDSLTIVNHVVFFNIIGIIMCVIFLCAHTAFYVRYFWFKRKPRNLRAVIFDLDGTIVETETLSAKALAGTMKELGYDFWEEIEPFYLEHCVGLGAGKILDNLSLKYTIKETREEWFAFFRKYREDFFKKSRPVIKEGLLELLEVLKTKKIKTAICSGTYDVHIKLKLETAGIPLDYFDVIVGGDMVKNQKPDPEIYNLALEKLGFSKDEALAIEDSDPGAMSAINAGVRLILIPCIKENSADVKNKSWRVVKSLAEVIKIV